MITHVSRNGDIPLPPEFVRQDDIRPGQAFDVERLNAGEYRVARKDETSDFDIVEWLLACPEKGFYTPIPSESTDDL